MRIGIDLGGTNTAAALCRADGTLLHKLSVRTKTGDPDGLREDMKKLALALCAKQGIQPEEIEQIGIGVPGSFDKESVTLCFGTNLGMNDVCFADTFVPEFSCPVKLDNDANCAALGEATAGAAHAAGSMLMVTLGTGVGGGIVLGGKLYSGCNDIAGEIGHMVIRQGGERCNCGRRGCLEAYTSASSFVRRTREALVQHPESALFLQQDELDAKMICDAVDAGDAFAKERFEEYCDVLSCGLANLINIFQPDCIVLGGGLAGYGEKLLLPLRERTYGQVYRAERKNTVIELAVLGNDAGLIGAAML